MRFPGRALALLGVVLAVACRDDAPATAPQPRTVGPVVKVVVTAPRQVLSPGDSVRFGAQAFDAQGMVLPTAAITWSSSRPSVATVDARGVVTALAAGTTQIVATSESQSGTVDVSVSIIELCDCTRIIDSTSMELVTRNDSTGVFVFRLLGGQAPAIDSGSIIVGAENGGFLRRVQRVERANNTLTLQTTQAYLEEAIRGGDFASTSFTEGETELIDEDATEAARWGPWTVAYLDPDVKLAASQCCSLSLDGVSISWPRAIFVNALGVKSTVGAEVTVKKGTIDFEPRMEIGGSFANFQLQSFRTVFHGGLGLNIDEYEARLTYEGSHQFTRQLMPKKKRRMARVVKPFSFFIGPVPVVGIVNKEISLQITPSVSVTTVLSGLFRTGFEVSAGAQWQRSGGWSPIAGSSSYLDASWPEFKGVEGSAAVKVAVVPEISILFYGVGGPYVNLEPYAQLEGETLLSFDAGTATGLDWETKVALGLNTNIGAKLSIFGFVDLVEVGFPIPIIRPYTLWRQFSDGSLTVRSRVTGQDRPDSLAIRLRPTFQDRWELGPLGLVAIPVGPLFGRSLATSSQDVKVALGPDGATTPPDTTVGLNTVTLNEIRSGPYFPHTIKLHDLPGNCDAGPSGRKKNEISSDTVSVRSGAFTKLYGLPQSEAVFYVKCIPLGALRVRTVTTGPNHTARSTFTLIRRDTVGSGKGEPPITLSIPGGATPPDTVIDKLIPVNPASGTNGRIDARLDPGRRNCAVAKPATHQSVITSGDTAFTEFRITCVGLGHTQVRTTTSDPDAAAPSEPVTYVPNVIAVDTADRMMTAPVTLGATDSSVVSGLIPVYNASGASGRHNVTLTNGPNRCTFAGGSARAVTVFPSDTAIAPFVMRCVERVHVATRSSGPGTDGDGYIVVIEYPDGSADSAAIAVADTIGIAGVRPGPATIRLADVDSNCSAPASVNRTISGRDSTLIAFTVQCPGPTAPTGLRATLVQTARIDVTWNPAPPNRPVRHYRLYRSEAGAAAVVFDSIAQTAHSSVGLTPFTVYAFQVAAVDSNGLVGPRSSVLPVRTLDATPPSAATNLTAAAANAFRINVAWTAAQDPETGIDRYRVYRDGVLIDSTSARSFADNGLTPNTAYTYHVIAVNGQGLSGPPSNSATATTLDATPPTAPGGLSATAVSTTAIDLAWTAASDPESGVQHYKIYRNGSAIGTSTTLTFNDQGLTPNTAYTYLVTAVNGANIEGPPSQPASATTLATPITGSLSVSTVSIGSNIPAGGYQVQVSAGSLLLTQPIGSSASVTFSALAPQTYTVTLQNLPSNCAVDDGPNPRSVVVTSNTTASTGFRVRCQ